MNLHNQPEHVMHYIAHHPGIALIVGLLHISAAAAMHEFQIPTIIMQCFQVGAWSVTITVGLITILGAVRRLLARRKANKTKHHE